MIKVIEGTWLPQREVNDDKGSDLCCDLSNAFVHMNCCWFIQVWFPLSLFHDRIVRVTGPVPMSRSQLSLLLQPIGPMCRSLVVGKGGYHCQGAPFQALPKWKGKFFSRCKILGTWFCETKTLKFVIEKIEGNYWFTSLHQQVIYNFGGICEPSPVNEEFILY